MRASVVSLESLLAEIAGDPSLMHADRLLDRLDVLDRLDTRVSLAHEVDARLVVRRPPAVRR